jgi:hypothetical protein
MRVTSCGVVMLMSCRVRQLRALIYWIYLLSSLAFYTFQEPFDVDEVYYNVPGPTHESLAGSGEWTPAQSQIRRVFVRPVGVCMQ